MNEHGALREIPSPSRRLWAGLCVILSIFVLFAIYAVHEIRWLEDFQVNVVQKNRKDSLQLLRIQNDAYSLAISLRDMTLAESKYPIEDYRSVLDRLRLDMDDALRLEAGFAVTTPGTEAMGRDKRAQLRQGLADFWQATDRVFALAASGERAQARELVETDLESRRAVIAEIAARLLVLNNQTQVEAAATISGVYGRVKRDLLAVVGVLLLLALATGLYTFEANRKTFARLHHLAEQLQSQSEELRRLSWKLIDVQEDTLRQVARDLHDEFGQILTAVGTMLGRAARNAPAESAGDRSGLNILLRDLQAVRNIVQETLQKVRDQSQMFRPAILDDFGLEQTLRWFVAQFSRQTGIDVQFEARLNEGYIPPEDAIHLYRIVQEALNNVARHSRSRDASVTLAGEDGQLSLEIRDHGEGWDAEARGTRAPGQGLGLMGMRERAEHLNGSLAVQSQPGTGTVIRVRVPLKRAALPRAAERVS